VQVLDTPLVKFAESIVRRRLRLLAADDYDAERVEPFIEARKQQWRGMGDGSLATMLILELGDHEFVRA